MNLFEKWDKITKACSGRFRSLWDKGRTPKFLESYARALRTYRLGSNPYEAARSSTIKRIAPRFLPADRATAARAVRVPNNGPAPKKPLLQTMRDSAQQLQQRP